MLLSEAKWLEDHRTTGWETLNLFKTLPGPLQDLRVSKVAGQSQIEDAVDPEGLHAHHVVHVRYFLKENKPLGALVPLVDDRDLRTAHQDERGLPVQVDELCIRVAEPLVEKLIREEAGVVPLEQSGLASFGAVHDQEEPLAPDLEHLDVVRLGRIEHFHCLEFGELVLLLVEFVDTRAVEELSDDHERLLVNRHRPAANHGPPCNNASHSHFTSSIQTPVLKKDQIIRLILNL